jgi:hypothetical protein
MDEDVLKYLNAVVSHGERSLELSRDGKHWICRICRLKGHNHMGELHSTRTPLIMRVRKHFLYYNHPNLDREWHLLPGAAAFFDVSWLIDFIKCT